MSINVSVSSGVSDAPADGSTYGRRSGTWIDLASAAALQFRQGTDSERLAMDPVPASGEPIYTTDTKRFFIGDGSTTGGRGVVTDSDSYVICQPGDNLLAKYTAAKALTPGGSAKSATNRAALLIYPGTYALGSSALDIDTDFVDVIGLGSSRWTPSVYFTSSTNAFFGGEDVVIHGLYFANGTIFARSGGAKRFVVNCGASSTFYSCNYVHSGALPDVIQGFLVGCTAGPNSGLSFGWFGGSPVLLAGRVNIFTGVVDGCLIRNEAFSGAIFQGIMRNCHFTNTATAPFTANGVMQGRAEYCTFPVLTAEIEDVSVGSEYLTGNPSLYTNACTISNASPAVVTLTDHGFYTGQRIMFATDDTLPTGLTAGTTYYVKRIDANTFNVSAALNGSDVNTSSAGAGTHTVEVPTYRKDGGWYSYCTTLDGEYTTT